MTADEERGVKAGLALAAALFPDKVSILREMAYSLHTKWMHNSADNARHETLS